MMGSGRFLISKSLADVAISELCAMQKALQPLRQPQENFNFNLWRRLGLMVAFFVLYVCART
jgi:hypothetical protein